MKRCSQRKRIKLTEPVVCLTKDTVQCVLFHANVYTAVAMQQVCRLWKRAISECSAYWIMMADKMDILESENVMTWVKRYSLCGYQPRITPLIFGEYENDSFALDLTSRLIRTFLGREKGCMYTIAPIVRFKALHPEQYLLPETANYKNGTMCRVFCDSGMFLFYFEKHVPIIFYKRHLDALWTLTSEARLVNIYKEMNSE